MSLENFSDSTKEKKNYKCNCTMFFSFFKLTFLESFKCKHSLEQKGEGLYKKEGETIYKHKKERRK